MFSFSAGLTQALTSVLLVVTAIGFQPSSAFGCETRFLREGVDVFQVDYLYCNIQDRNGSDTIEICTDSLPPMLAAEEFIVALVALYGAECPVYSALGGGDGGPSISIDPVIAGETEGCHCPNNSDLASQYSFGFRYYYPDPCPNATQCTSTGCAMASKLLWEWPPVKNVYFNCVE